MTGRRVKLIIIIIIWNESFLLALLLSDSEVWQIQVLIIMCVPITSYILFDEIDD